MKASEIITRLQSIIDDNGDMDVKYFVCDGEFYAEWEDVSGLSVRSDIFDYKFIDLDIN